MIHPALLIGLVISPNVPLQVIMQTYPLLLQGGLLIPDTFNGNLATM